MPTYDYVCECGKGVTLIRPIGERNDPLRCIHCNLDMDRVIGPVMFKFKGVVTPGGGMDRFTADMLGVPLKELPEGLRTKGLSGNSV